MGQQFYKKIIILIGCFSVALAFLIFVYQGTISKHEIKKKTLIQALREINGWVTGESAVIEPNIVKALELDDYINQGYVQGEKKIHLYIGFYHTNKKIGAAHDPLVCFPGQGWETSEIQEGKISLNGNPKKTINYSMMVTKRGEDRQLVIYWFQVGDQTSSNTFFQKILGFSQKVFKQREENAFVRLSMKMQTRSKLECRDDILVFIKSFYPVFLSYIES